jgi:YidC/Oxa1 family membrane protein insertase
MDKKTILAIALSLGVLLIYQAFFAPKPHPPKQAAPVQESKQAVTDNKEKPQTPATAAGKAPGLAAPKSEVKHVAARKEAAPQDIKVETENYTAVFSTRGAALKSFQLKKYHKECVNCTADIYPAIKSFFTGVKQPAKPTNKELIELVSLAENMPYPLAVTFPESDTAVSATSVYDTNSRGFDLLSSKEKQSLVFSRTFSDGTKVEKTYTFSPDNYFITLDVKVTNLSGVSINRIPHLNWYEYDDPKQVKDRYSSQGPVAYVSKAVKRKKVADISEETSLGPDVSWGGFEMKYFMSIIIPQDPSLTSIGMSKDSNNVVTVNIKGTKNIIPPDQSGLFSYSLFLGPKDYSLVKKQGIFLEEAIEFDSFIPGLKWLSIGLLYFIKFLYSYIANYGIAIILLTVLIKILFWPLGTISFRSMKEMQKLQPKILELREKHKNDQAKLGQETMALYRAHKVNPMSGCLPILIQIPVFIALYNTLLYAIELRHSPFFWWIQDLATKDPYYITPIIMGATQFIQQKMTPTTGDPMQAKVMLMMPIVFTFIFLNFPAGLVLYWLLNNVLSIGQQIYINKKTDN